MRRIIQIFIVMVLSLWGGSAIEAQTSESAASASVAEQLRQTESKKRLARQEIAQLEDRVEAEVQHIIGRLDDLFRGDHIQEQFNKHHAEAKDILQGVSLPGDVGSWEVTWKQWKSLKDPKGLEALVEEFIEDAQLHLEPARESLEDSIAASFGDVVAVEIGQAQKDIRVPFQDILIRYFPVWEGHGLRAPPLPELTQRPGIDPAASRSGALAVAGAAGLALSTLLRAKMRKEIIRKTVRRVVAKIVGRVASRAVAMMPVIGQAVAVLLVLYDVANITQAKAKLEDELRTQYAATYASELTPRAFWEQPSKPDAPSFRQKFQQDVHDHLYTWSQHCRQEVERMLDAARTFTLSPNIKAYITQQDTQGRNTREIVEDMTLVAQVFEDHLIARVPFVKLFDMIIYAPDRQELSLLAQVLDNRLLREYEQHGREVLVAAHTLGVELFLEAMDASADLDWPSAQRAFEQYPHDMNDQARRGLLLLLLEKLDYAGVPPSTLERIVRHEAVFRALLPVLLTSDREKLFDILAQDQVLRIVEKGYEQHAGVMDGFIEAWPSRTWKRYERESRFQALFILAAYRMEERRQPANAFAEEISQRDELTPIYEEVGLDGLRLWDVYVTPSTGEHQRRLAKQAIDLYKAGYPLDDLSEREGLELAALYNHIPLINLKLYNLFKPLGKAVYLAFVLFALLIVTAPLLMFFKVGVTVPLLMFLKVGRKFLRSGLKRESKGGEAPLADNRQHDEGTRTDKKEDAEERLSSADETDDETRNRNKQNNQGPQT